MKKFLYWLPRILAILFTIFVTLFALDVFEEKQWFMALLIHLIPSYILIISTIVAWKKELVGGIIFILLGILFLAISRINLSSLIIVLPAVIIGGLFFLSWKYKK